MSPTVLETGNLTPVTLVPTSLTNQQVAYMGSQWTERIKRRCLGGLSGASVGQVPPLR